MLAASPRLLEGLAFENLLPQTDAVPERFELGTLPYELLAGTTAAVDFLASLRAGAGAAPPRPADRRHGRHRGPRGRAASRDRARAGASCPASPCTRARAHRTPTLLVTFDGRAAGDAYAFLAERGVNAPAGSFYALEASRQLGLGDDGGLRIGLAPYSDADDVARLLDGPGAPS